jgi:hypothetical protein
MPASTLDGRLLCASGTAYSVVADQAPVAPDPTNYYLAGAGFVQPPIGLVGGPDQIDACLVGQNSDGIVIAFRGTLPLDLIQAPSLLDWLDDFEAAPVPAAGFPGFIHQGFVGVWGVLFPKITVELAKLQVASPGLPVYLTGHSKGGAVATLVAWSLNQAGITPRKVVTIAAAKPADTVFSAAYDATGIDHVRYEYNNDIVPHLPLSDGGFLDFLSAIPGFDQDFSNLKRFDYQPVGTLWYIESGGQIISDNQTLRAERDGHLAAEIIEHGLRPVFDDHSITCGSGYLTAIAPEGVCPTPGT